MAGEQSYKVGNIILWEKGMYEILKKEHVKPGKGPAYFQLEMKEINTGTKVNTRIGTDVRLEKLNEETQELQFLYKDEDKAFLMNKENFDQIEVSLNLFNGFENFLEDEMIVRGEYVGNTLIKIRLPIELKGEIAETQNHIKNASANSMYKPALLTNGYKVNVPHYIENGQKVIINSETGEFIGKA